jgi:hypothetical protein
MRYMKLCHIDLQATTAEISPYMTCHSYWKLYHWQPQQKYDVYSCGDAYKPLYMQLLLTVKRRFTIALCTATAPASWSGCGCP